MGLMDQKICRSDNIYIAHIICLITNVFNTSINLANSNNRSTLSYIIDHTVLSLLGFSFIAFLCYWLCLPLVGICSSTVLFIEGRIIYDRMAIIS